MQEKHYLEMTRDLGEKIRLDSEGLYRVFKQRQKRVRLLFQQLKKRLVEGSQVLQVDFKVELLDGGDYYTQRSHTCIFKFARSWSR